MSPVHHRHRNILEGLPKFLSCAPLVLNDRIQARHRFYDILQHYEDSKNVPKGPYNRLTLLRAMYDYAISERSKDNVLRAFFNAIGLSMDEQDDLSFLNKEIDDQIYSKLTEFADFLIDSFFLPCKLPETLLFLLLYFTVTNPYQ